MKADINEDRATGRSRGFGTVLFETGEQAAAAIEVCEEALRMGLFEASALHGAIHILWHLRGIGVLAAAAFYHRLEQVDQHLHAVVVQALNGHDIDGRTVSAKMDEYA